MIAINNMKFQNFSILVRLAAALSFKSKAMAQLFPRLPQDDVVFIDPLACQGAKACQNNDIQSDDSELGSLLNITGDGPCSGADACSDNTQTSLMWITTACTGEKSLSKNYGTCSSNQDFVFIGDGSCTGASSCSNNTQGILLSENSCTGTHSCSDNDSMRLVTDGSGCTGDVACSNNLGDRQFADIGVYTDFFACDGACSGTGSCSMGQGEFTALQESCTGDNSCQSWQVGKNRSAIPTRMLSGPGSCTGENSCQSLVSADEYGYITIGADACTGANSCQNIIVAEGNWILSIGEGACTENNSCQNCENTIIGGGCQNCESECDTKRASAAVLSLGLVAALLVLVTGGY